MIICCVNVFCVCVVLCGVWLSQLHTTHHNYTHAYVLCCVVLCVLYVCCICVHMCAVCVFSCVCMCHVCMHIHVDINVSSHTHTHTPIKHTYTCPHISKPQTIVHHPERHTHTHKHRYRHRHTDTHEHMTRSLCFVRAASS